MTALNTATSVAEEIRSSVEGDHMARAVRRLLDYAKFSGTQDSVNEAIVFSREFNRLLKQIRLHKLRTEIDYREAYAPDPDVVEQKLRILDAYLKKAA